METVTVTVVGEAECPVRERKISRVRKISDVLTNVVTLNHHHSQAGSGATGGNDAEPRERKISSSRVRKISDVLDSSRVRKISDALTNIVTLNHHHPHNTFVGTLTSQNSVSLADLLKSEQTPDTLSLHSGRSIDYTAAGINNIHGAPAGGGDNKDHPPDHHHEPNVLETVAKAIAGGKGKKWPQVLASIAANMGAFAFGSVLAWSSPGLVSMQESEDLGEVSSGVSSWIGSIPMLGAVAACPFAGFALDTLGRRRSMLYLTVPFIIGWLFIGLAQNFFMVLLGRFVTGFCGGCFSVAAPIFTAETADAKIRGALGSFFDLLLSAGQLYIYVAGVFLPWRYQAFACAAIPVAFHVIMFFVPESPRYLVQKEKEHKAEKAIYWLKGNTIHPDHVEKEMSDLRTSVGEQKGDLFAISDLWSRALLQPTAILVGIMFFTTLSSIDAIIAYTTNIFESAGSTMDPKIATIIIGVVTMLGSVPTAALVDLAGRRVLLMLSELVMTISLIIMGLYFYMMRTGFQLFGSVGSDDVNWLPLASLVLFIIGYSLGCGPLSMLMIGELLPNKLKGLTSCIVVMTRWFLAFGVTNIFGTLKESINDDGTYWLFASICFVGIFFVFFAVPETKGKSLAEIQLYFIGHKQNNITIAVAAQDSKGEKEKGQMPPAAPTSPYCYDNKGVEVDI